MALPLTLVTRDLIRTVRFPANALKEVCFSSLLLPELVKQEEQEEESANRTDPT